MGLVNDKSQRMMHPSSVSLWDGKKWCYTFQPTQFRVSLFLDDCKGGLMVGRCVPYGIEVYQVSLWDRKKWCYTFQPTQFRVSLFLNDCKGGLMVGRCVPYGIEVYQDRQIRLLNHVIKGGEGLLSCMHLISYRITRSINMLQVTQHLWTRNSF